MAGMKTSEMEVCEQLQDITECCVCNETYNDPKMLPCVHTFCRTCLEEIGCKTGKRPGDQIPCPMCRKEFTIPEEGYAALQKNFFMEKLIEMAKIASPSEGPDLCEACMEVESASTSASEVPLAGMYCHDCQKKLCQECSKHHRKNKLTRKHNVAAADFKCKVQIAELSSCIKHKRELDLYCSDCKKLLCKQCFGEGHQNHRLQDVRNVGEGFKNDIKDILSCLEVCISEDLEKKEILHCEVEEYCKNLESLKLEVRAQTDATLKLVTEHADLIMQDIDQLKVQKREEVKAEIEDSDGDLNCLESFKVHCAKVMTEGSTSDILCCTIDELKARCEDIKKMHESSIEVKTYFRKKSFQVSNLEEFAKTPDFNMIGTIQECQTEVEREGEANTTSDNISPDGNIAMEDDCRIPTSSNSGFPETINHLKQELENERRRIFGLEMEKKALEKRINERDLEVGIKRPKKSTLRLSMAQPAQPLCTQLPPPRISIDYNRSPNLVQKLQRHDGWCNRGSIFGLTVVGNELFLGCFIACMGHSVVEAYDIRTFDFKREWRVKLLSESNTGVVRISSMASCTRHKCLYASVSIVPGFAGYKISVIQRTDVNGRNAKEWKIINGGGCFTDLSVTREGNIILTGIRSLIEYSRDGVVVHEMKLPCNLGIKHPLHALKLASGNFVVSHGRGKDQHRVLILSENGQITKSFGDMPVSGVGLRLPQVNNPRVLNEPVYLTVDGFGNILVADRGNNRIVVLNSNLELQSTINPTPRLLAPSYMCVDDARRRLFVCEGVKKISVFDFSF